LVITNHAALAEKVPKIRKSKLSLDEKGALDLEISMGLQVILKSQGEDDVVHRFIILGLRVKA
jgi:hypothetical protein